ncbi:Eco57I restriction-modification methylase domain-containing protein [Haloarcula sp. S1AR25-4]|uniref:Eco57I restriction-modification methylase domain-containing protein n=1 Tax=Haloarcula sp. S1AR25-4 TaxID=2950538 RepID=UPI0037BEF2BC
MDEGAVEICKLRLWLSMVADIEDEPNEVEPLPNIDFNIRQGNTLIGFTDVEEVATKSGDASLSNYGGGTGTGIKEMYEGVIEAIERHQDATSSKVATNARKLAESRIESHSEKLNKKILDQFHDAGIEEIGEKTLEEYHPFHWVIEFPTIYRDGGFDIIIGNPPWDVLTPDRSHFFPKYDERFRTRLPSEKDRKEEELLSNPDIAAEYEEFKKNMQIRSDYYNSSDQYKLQKPTVGGQTVATETDLSLLFFERVTQLAGSNSYVAQIMPGNFFLGATAKDLRRYLIDKTSVEHFVQFENNGIFQGLHGQYKFAICTFKNTGATENVEGGFAAGDTSILRNFDQNSINIPAEVLLEYSPESRIFPFFRSQELIDSLSKFVDHPPIGEKVGDDWFVSLYMKELDRANDSNLLIEQQEDGDYPIYEGKNMHQFAYDDTSVFDINPISLWGVDEGDPDRSAKHRVRMKNFRSRDPDASLKKAIYNKFDGSGSQKSFVNDLLEQHGRPELSKEDVLLDCTKYRIAIRKITNSTNERTLIAGVIPKDTVTVHSIATVRPHVVEPTEDDLGNYPMHSAYEEVFTDEELFVVLGLLNSIPIDYLMRTKIDTNIVQYKLNETQLPRLTAGDNWFNWISQRAARLNCYGDEFSGMRDRLGGIDPATDAEKRRELQAEIDAAAFHAYGMNEEETRFILNDFYQVDNPKLMDDPYFDLVFEKYSELDEEGPYP